MKYFTLISAALLTASLLCFIALIDYPKIGHDYAYLVPLSIDFSTAWTKFGVLNPLFSSLKCLGIPVWANPNSLSFSIFHFYSLFLDPITAIITSYATLTIIIFFGAYLFSGLFLTDVFVKICFAIGWTLQAKLVLNAIVGHYSYMILGLFPFIFALLIQKQNSRTREVLSIFALVIMFSQFVFNAALYAIIIWFPAAIITALSLHFMGFEFKTLRAEFSYLVKRNLLIVFVSFLICLPKLIAIYGWMANYPRHISFLNVGILKVLEYSFYNLLIPVPFDAKSSIGWSYGNWESNQTIFPFLALGLILLFFAKKNTKELKKLLIFLGTIFCVSVLINSGIYADVFASLPLLSSFHVNPRWNTIILLPLFSGYVYLVSKNLALFKKKYWVVLAMVFMFFPFLYVDRENNKVNYTYMDGYNAAKNRLSYCYEPVFGYRLESFPTSARKLYIMGNQLIDPRCYLKNSNCAPGTVINENDQRLLEEYKLN